MKNQSHPAEDEEKPTRETIANRRAGDAAMREAAAKGDGICGAYFALMSDAEAMGLGFVETMVDWDEEDWDDVRPY